MYLTITFICLSYFIGSISSAIIVCKIMGLADPRMEGSGNPGATNVLRIGGKKAAVLTLLGDSLKGFLPVTIANYLGFNDTILALVALAAFLGHLFPIYFGFKGGKGVATFLGCLFALNWPTGLVWSATWLVIAFLFRYSSLAAIIASLLAPIYMSLLSNNPYFFLVTAIMAFIIIIKHRENITRLVQGREKRIMD